MTTKGIYIHIPFCDAKCTYCDFYSVSSDTETMVKYTDTLVSELKEISSLYPTNADTVYIGGGTPSVLPPFLLEKIVKTVYDCFGNSVKEFTMEANPCSCAYPKEYRALGINRISLGVQTLNDKLLGVIGRRHTSSVALNKLAELAGIFDNVSADLIIGLPGQTVKDVVYAVDNIAPLVKHLSMYMLKLSDTVPMAASVRGGNLVLPDDDLTVDMYEEAYARMTDYGLHRYEISNFARDGYASAHNLKYWLRQEYIGAGCSAHGFIGSLRYQNPSNLAQYIDGKRFGRGTAETLSVDKQTALFETIMLAFRLSEGLDVDAVNSAYNIDFEKLYSAQLKKLAPLLVHGNGRIAIRDDKLLLESAVAREFLP